MSTSTKTQEVKIELKISQELKEKLQKAANMRCMILDEYLLEILQDAAEQPIPEPESIVLSERDWEKFVSAIENPPEPNEALKAAIKENQEKYGKW
ncbi:DUF1778 domain-containing protein [Argonema antarcticum]|uniref:type II toxin-antitoxin system TacA family antitoxin n=1 Tax=Argonema antarcticum TaxID=2942763 RepID=UPI0020119C0F|nr:DUF1778 domain-containing protein [Argonema antarcticum]MCL1474517.1 DUF1778 domain-containing protein [Argonema antarcticum A004/B2]